MRKVAIIGFGNVGRAAYEALIRCGDMTLCGVVSSQALHLDAPVVQDIAALPETDVAVVCTPSREVPVQAAALLARGISTVDSFDIHQEIVPVRAQLDAVAKAHGCVSVLSAGWDPGTDSVVRVLAEAMVPRGITYTNFGPGMSMGHTAAVKAIPGVRRALSLTIPLGTGIHRRMVYVEAEPDMPFDAVAAAIKADAYFQHDETHVIQVDNVDAVTDMGHGVELVRKGASGAAQNQQITFGMRIDNPALTGQILIAAARAAGRQTPGCYTLVEIPPIHLLEGETDALIARLV